MGNSLIQTYQLWYQSNNSDAREYTATTGTTPLRDPLGRCVGTPGYSGIGGSGVSGTARRQMYPVYFSVEGYNLGYRIYDVVSSPYSKDNKKVSLDTFQRFLDTKGLFYDGESNSIIFNEDGRLQSENRMAKRMSDGLPITAEMLYVETESEEFGILGEFNIGSRNFTQRELDYIEYHRIKRLENSILNYKDLEAQPVYLTQEERELFDHADAEAKELALQNVRVDMHKIDIGVSMATGVFVIALLGIFGWYGAIADVVITLPSLSYYWGYRKVLQGKLYNKHKYVSPYDLLKM